MLSEFTQNVAEICSFLNVCPAEGPDRKNVLELKQRLCCHSEFPEFVFKAIIWESSARTGMT